MDLWEALTVATGYLAHLECEDIKERWLAAKKTCYIATRRRQECLARNTFWKNRRERSLQDTKIEKFLLVLSLKTPTSFLPHLCSLLFNQMFHLILIYLEICVPQVEMSQKKHLSSSQYRFFFSTDGLEVIRNILIVVFSLSFMHNLLLGFEFTYMIPQTKYTLIMTACLAFLTGNSLSSFTSNFLFSLT